MSVDFETSPKLYAILDSQEPQKREAGRRTIILSHGRPFDDEWIAPAVLELAVPKTVQVLTASEIAVLAYVAGEKMGAVEAASDLAAAVSEIVERRRQDLAVPLARIVLANTNHRREIKAALPNLLQSNTVIEAMTDLMADGVTLHINFFLDPLQLRLSSLDQARRALPLTADQFDKDLRIYLLSALARGLGWTAWVKLQTILLELPTLAGEDDVERPTASKSPSEAVATTLRQEAWDQIVSDAPVRIVAQLIGDLEGVLAYARPDVRGVYVGRLKRAIGADQGLRRATIEALLDRPHPRQDDLGLFAAISLAQADDEGFIEELAAHPNRDVGYRASLVQQVVLGVDEDASAWSRPTITGIAEGLFQLRLAASTQGPPRTWLGDRLVEQMIEHTAASEEEKFAREYPDHSESDEEEGLLRIFFENLAQQFRQLDQALLATARATRAPRHTRVRIDYRSVSKSEEGKKGISPTGEAAEAPDNFSADLCLIVDPHLEGKSLGKRATLIQAKRLYRRDTTQPEKGFASSYRLKPNQMEDLLKQSASSFYLFQGPGSHGRGIPVLPTQLVSDLAFHQAPSAGQIDCEEVGLASQTFAEWLTYEVLALRTGDPLEQLVVKAGGGAGRKPRELGRFGTVEIEVHAGGPLKERE